MEWKLVLYGAIVLLIFSAGFYAKGFTGNVIAGDKETSYTKTVCNNGQCIDVYVECTSDGIQITPLTPYATINVTKFNITNEIKC